MLGAAVRRAASEAGRPLSRYVAPLGASPLQRLREIENCARPTARTVRRINQLLAGEPLEATRVHGSTTRDARAGIAAAPEMPVAAPVARDPCWRCGTRADLGCGCRA